jgi:drug/metabolite transporter (DMT)-like permease
MILNKILIITTGIIVLILGLIFGVSYPEQQIAGVLIMFLGLYCAINGIGYGDNKN